MKLSRQRLLAVRENRWNPTHSLSGTFPILWLDASRITGLNDGDVVTTWLDLSGSGNNATQSTANLKPLFKTNILNGRSVVRFDGINDFMELGDFGGGLSSFTVFVVGVAADPINKPFTLLGGRNDAGTNATNLQFYSVTASKVLRSIVGYTSSAATTTYTDNMLIQNQVFLSCWDWVGGHTRNFLDSQLSLITGNTGNPTVSGINRFLGASSDNNGATHGSYCYGDIAEVLIYNRKLTDAERHDVEDYLK